MTFPYHREPDGNRFAPHHHLIGCYIVLLLSIASAVELGRFPYVTVIGAGVGLFAFLHFWYDLGAYPAVGAVGSLLGLVIAAAGLLVFDPFLLPHRLLAGLGVLVALDDALQHAFGVQTPLDTLWKRLIFPRVGA